jgi:hypothetical protein
VAFSTVFSDKATTVPEHSTDIAALEAGILARLNVEVPDLLKSYPLERYIASLDEEGGYGGYARVPPLVESWCAEIQSRHGTSILEDYHRLLLLTLVRCFDERTVERRYPDSVLMLYRKYLRNVAAQMSRNPPGFYLHENDLFAKDLAVCRQKLIPCGAQLVDVRAGVPRRLLWKGGLSQLLKLAVFMPRRVGGWRPLYQLHMDLRLLLEFNPSGWNRCYRRIGALLELNPSILGVFGASWWFDPRLEEVSPRLAFLRTLPESHGARVFRQGADDLSTQDALANSRQREELYRQGLYKPENCLLVWGRDDLIAWAKAQKDSTP